MHFLIALYLVKSCLENRNVELKRSALHLSHILMTVDASAQGKWSPYLTQHQLFQDLQDTFIQQVLKNLMFGDTETKSDIGCL